MAPAASRAGRRDAEREAKALKKLKRLLEKG